MSTGTFQEPKSLYQIILDILESNMYTDISSKQVRTAMADAICASHYSNVNEESYGESDYPQTEEDCK